jgi:hypothetical protein
VIHEKVHHAPRITVWVAISSHALLGPVFFEDTANSEHYLSMLHNTFVPQLLATGLLLQLTDSCRMEPGHTQRMLFWTFFMTLLTRMSSSSNFLIMSHGQNWPLNSPDLSPCDYFLWVFLKEKISPKQPQTIMELRALIIQDSNEITEDMCCRVINITVDIQEVVRHNGGHIEHLVHRG